MNGGGDERVSWPRMETLVDDWMVVHGWVNFVVKM